MKLHLLARSDLLMIDNNKVSGNNAVGDKSASSNENEFAIYFFGF